MEHNERQAEGALTTRLATHERQQFGNVTKTQGVQVQYARMAMDEAARVLVYEAAP